MGVRLNNVLFTYDKRTVNEKKALSNISLNIENGEFVVLLGNPGCGKSTLLKLIEMIEKPESGDVIVDTGSVMLFQNPECMLFAQTVLDDVMYGPLNSGLSQSDAMDAALSALRAVGISEDLFGSAPYKLSGGQKRKVALAGIIAMNKPLILLDEPTAGLDNNSAEDLLKTLSDLNSMGTTVVIATHDFNIASKYASRVVVMHKGNVVFDDTVGNLTRNCHNFSEYGIEVPAIYTISHLLYKEGLVDRENLGSATEVFEALKKTKK